MISSLPSLAVHTKRLYWTLPNIHYKTWSILHFILFLVKSLSNINVNHTLNFQIKKYHYWYKNISNVRVKIKSSKSRITPLIGNIFWKWCLISMLLNSPAIPFYQGGCRWEKTWKSGKRQGFWKKLQNSGDFCNRHFKQLSKIIRAATSHF